MTVIVVTHEPDIATYASRELMVKDGQIVDDRRTASPGTASRRNEGEETFS